MVQLSHPYITTGKNIALTRWTFVDKVMSLLFNTLSRFVIAFLPRRNFMAAVTICSDFGTQWNKVCHRFHCFPIHLPWSDGTGSMIFVFWILSFMPAFSLSSFILIKRFFSSSLSAITWCHLHIWSYCYFSWQSWFQVVLHPAWHFAWSTLYISTISRETIHSVDIHLCQFGTSQLFHVQF